MKAFSQKMKYVALALCILLIANAAAEASKQRIRSATQMRNCRALLNLDKPVVSPSR